MSNYKCISNFGPSIVNDPNTNPLSYCLLQTVDSGFMHGGIGTTMSGKHSANCQAFMSSYCANKWDDVCEFVSKDTSQIYPNTQQRCATCNGAEYGNINAGDILIANTAERKYLTQMGGNCSIKWQPFDPTVASSPYISTWQGGCNSQGNGGCVPVYEVDPKTINDDPVMQKILAKPSIARNLLVNIYNTAVRKGTFNDLKGTDIYKLFISKPFQDYIKVIKTSGYR